MGTVELQIFSTRWAVSSLDLAFSRDELSARVPDGFGSREIGRAALSKVPITNQPHPTAKLQQSPPAQKIYWDE